MIDRYGRNIEYVRLSLTERCNLKCIYCRKDEGGDCFKNKNELTPKQWQKIVSAMAALGIKKVRVTGGEPLIRKDLEEIIAGIGQIKGIEDICMTTNAQGLAKRLPRLKEAGLSRLNISIDSLKKERYFEITKGGSIEDVLSAVDQAIALSMFPIKLNAVLMRGRNDDEVDDFIALTKDRPIHVRFIELMPFSDLGSDRDERISNSELIAARNDLIPIEPEYAGQPSTDYRIEGHLGKVGFISPVSHRFCSECNRIRVTSDGHLKLCLGDNSEISLLKALNSDEDTLIEVIRAGIYNKPKGHSFEQGFHSNRDMSRIGG